MASRIKYWSFKYLSKNTEWVQIWRLVVWECILLWAVPLFELRKTDDWWIYQPISRTQLFMGIREEWCWPTCGTTQNSIGIIFIPLDLVTNNPDRPMKQAIWITKEQINYFSAFARPSCNWLCFCWTTIDNWILWSATANSMLRTPISNPTSKQNLYIKKHRCWNLLSIGGKYQVKFPNHAKRVKIDNFVCTMDFLWSSGRVLTKPRTTDEP